MPITPADYKVIAVLPGGGVIEKRKRGAPPENWMIDFGRARRAAFVIRYFPSKKGWRVLDIRKVLAVPVPGGAGGRPLTIYTGQGRGTRYYPNEDAAVMVAIHALSGHSSTL